MNIDYLINDKYKIGISIDRGPRIIYFSKKESNNNLFHETNFSKNQWNLFGGHRLWLAPEHEEHSYIADNSQVERVSKKNHNIYYNHYTNQESDYILGFDIIDKKDFFLIRNFAYINKFFTDKSSLWSITLCKPGGNAYIPIVISSSLSPYFNICHWPYNDFNKKQYEVSKNNYIKVRQGLSIKSKIGTFQSSPISYYEINNTYFTKKLISYSKKEIHDFDTYIEKPFVKNNKELDYSNYSIDMYSNNQIYNCSEYIELEHLSPTFEISKKNGNLYCMDEIWSIDCINKFMF